MQTAFESVVTYLLFYTPLLFPLLHWLGAMLGLRQQRNSDKLNRWKVAAWMFAPPMIGCIMYALLWLGIYYASSGLGVIFYFVWAIIGGLVFSVVLATVVAFSGLAAYLVDKRMGEKIKNRYLQYTIGVLAPYLLAVLIPALIWIMIVAYSLWWPK